MFEVQSFENVFNTAKNINNISILGNSLFKPVKNIITSSQREPWQKDAYEFYNIYKSMDEKEKKEFLKSISMTEYDIVSVKRMTKEQWNVFLQNVLPHVSLYIKKSEDNINLQNYIQQNHNLSYVLDMTQNQWLNFKTVLLNNTDNNLNSLKQFFKNTVEENNSFAKWEIEKKNFINFVYNNKYESFVNEAVKSAEFYKSQNNEFNQNNIYFSESKADEMSSKLTEWMTYLTESQWNEVKTVLTTSKETEYIKPVLEIIKSQKAEETEPEFSAEKRGVIEYIKNNKKLSVEILRELAEKDEIKKELTGWVDLKVLDKKTTEVNETARKNILNENIEVNKNSEEISPNSEVINNLSAQFTEWLSYLTESQWNEVKTVLTANEETEYIKPVLEIIKSQKTEETEPEFSAEKRSVIEYIKNNKKLSVDILQRLSENEEIKKELINWVDLKELKNEEFRLNKSKITPKTDISGFYLNGKYITNASENLAKWLEYTTKSQWDDIKAFINTQQDNEYLNPVLSNVNIQTAENDENAFNEQKKEFIRQIVNNKEYASNFINLAVQNKGINDIITDLAKKTEINSLSKTEETYEIDNVEKVLTSNKAQRAKTNNETIKRILNWAYNTESNSEVKRQIRNKFVNEVRNEVKYDENILNSSYSTSNKFFEKIYKKRKEAIPQIMSQLYTAKDINSVYTNEKFNASMAQNGKYFSANLINRINSGSAENELSQYTTADLVIAKSNNVKGAVKNPVKMPDITTQVQQAVKTQVNDIIKINKSSEIQQSENKTIYELTRRINLQQKEIESIITNQRQMLKITDISVVAEKVMNQMQSQLRLEKMRRGL